MVTLKLKKLSDMLALWLVEEEPTSDCYKFLNEVKTTVDTLQTKPLVPFLSRDFVLKRTLNYIYLDWTQNEELDNSVPMYYNKIVKYLNNKEEN